MTKLEQLKVMVAEWDKRKASRLPMIYVNF